MMNRNSPSLGTGSLRGRNIKFNVSIITTKDKTHNSLPKQQKVPFLPKQKRALPSRRLPRKNNKQEQVLCIPELLMESQWLSALLWTWGDEGK